MSAFFIPPPFLERKSSDDESDESFISVFDLLESKGYIVVPVVCFVVFWGSLFVYHIYFR